MKYRTIESILMHVVAVAAILFAFWIAVTPVKAADTKTLLAELIRLNGYDCPAIRTLTAEGNDHRGKVFKVWCGGHSGTNAWNVKAIEFRLVEIGTPHSLGYDILVSPWPGEQR